MISTIHKAVERFTGKCDRTTGEQIFKPEAILDYTKKMGGVDLSDQLMNYYHFLRRGQKWWRKLCIHLFNMVLSNAHVLNKNFGIHNKLSHHEYRYTIAAALLDFTEIDNPIGPAAPTTGCRQGHWPERLEKSTKTNKTKTRKCKYCFVSAKQAARSLQQ